MSGNNKNLNPSLSFYKKNNLDLDVWWFSVASIDYEKLIQIYLFEELLSSFDTPEIKVLDLGCGTAKFPSLLDSKIANNILLSSDFVDISQDCLEYARSVLSNLKHFNPDRLYRSSTEDIQEALSQTSKYYDIIWAIHSFSTLEKTKILKVYKYLLELLKPNGKFLVYQLSQYSWYYKSYDFYLKHYPQPSRSTSFMTGEDIKNALDSLGINYKIFEINYHHTVKRNSSRLLEVYLKKCILNASVDAVDLFSDILPSYYDKGSDAYIFPQKAILLEISN